MITITIPGLCKKPEPEEPGFMVMPLSDAKSGKVHPFGKQVAAPDARTALLKARSEGLDKFLHESGRLVDGWLVYQWIDEAPSDGLYRVGHWADPLVFEKDVK